jgi:hypothetical protein
MRDMASSVLVRLKIKRWKVAEVINCVCNYFARKNF